MAKESQSVTSSLYEEVPEDHESIKSEDEFEVIERMSQCTMTTIQDEQQQIEEEPVSDDASREAPSAELSPTPVTESAEAQMQKSGYAESLVSSLSSYGSWARPPVAPSSNDSLRDVQEAISARRAPAEAALPPITTAQLQERIDVLQAQLAEKESLEDELEQAKDEAKQYRRALDEKTAQLLSVEDQVQQMRSLHVAGFVDMGEMDIGMAHLLNQKECDVQKVHEENRELKRQLDEMMHRLDAVSRELNEQQGLVQQVHAQRCEDANIYEKQIREYEARIRALVMLATPRSANNAPSVLVCPQCQARVAAEDTHIYANHVARCRGANGAARVANAQ